MMQMEFKPKVDSQYNKSVGIRKAGKKLDFVPREVKIEKRIPKQFSYASRVERENMRVYNG